MANEATHPGFILAVEREYVTEKLKLSYGFSKVNINEFVAGIDPYLVLKQRSSLEEDSRYLQILPYTVITSSEDPFYVYAYQRTKKVGESRLAGAYSVGWGGHIDMVDLVVQKDIHGRDISGVIDFTRTVFNNAMRELKEEINAPGIVFTPALLNFRGIIMDNRRKVENVHLAMVFELQVKSITTEITASEEELISVGFQPLLTAQSALYSEKLQTITNELEPWSKIVTEQFAAHSTPHHPAAHAPA